MSHYFRQDFLTVPDGAALYYQVQGEGEPGMVLCDGLGCDGFVWKYLAPYLGQSYRVLRWHYRGHGRSGLPRERQRIGMLYTCDEAFFTGTASEVIAIRQVDGRVIGSGKPGPITRDLRSRFQALVRS